MKSELEEHYPKQMIGFLEAIWGEGFLSPGGPEEVTRIVGNEDLTGLKLLDIGCGGGGIDIALVKTHNARHVTGIDVEKSVISHAENLVKKYNLANRIKIIKVKPGPLPFPDGIFDVVFSKDSIVHIPDKHKLMADIFRILKPGGKFLASDWLIGSEPASTEMKKYIAAEGLDFQMTSPARYQDAMKKAGFINIRITSRNLWYREEARKEVAALEGPLATKAAEKSGKEFLDKNIETWKLMISVLDSGEHCPSHLYAVKPK